jgi:hypothetical protein
MAAKTRQMKLATIEGFVTTQADFFGDSAESRNLSRFVTIE